MGLLGLERLSLYIPSSRQHLACAITSVLTFISRDSHSSPSFLCLWLSFLSG